MVEQLSRVIIKTNIDYKNFNTPDVNKGNTRVDYHMINPETNHMIIY